MAKAKKVPITRRALEQRVKRLLAKTGAKLVKHRGDYVVISPRNIPGLPIDLVEFGEEHELIEPWEAVEEGK